MTSSAPQTIANAYGYTRAVRDPPLRPYPNPSFEWASEYLSRGLSVVHIPFRTKMPIIKEWQNLEISANNLAKYFNGQRQNIGVILGERSGWLVDVDLDSPEAVKLADFFLPQTASKFGRKGKPSSHRLYVCKDGEYKKFNNPLMLASKAEGDRKSACIVEIRTGKGKQTVFPGSIHECGESIEWVIDGEPSNIEFLELEKSVKRLTAACVLVRYWKHGLRHELSLAVCGVLLRHGYSTDETKHFIKAICFAANDEELVDRLNGVDDTATAINKGKKVFGIPKLVELTDQKIVDLFCAWMEIQSKPTSIVNAADLNGQKPSSFTFTMINDLLKEPDELNEYVWDKTLPLGGLSILAAKPKVGKSTFARNLAVAVARGEEFFGRTCSPGTVIYLVLEEKRAEVTKHFRNLNAGDLPILVYSGRTPVEALAALKQAIQDHSPILVIVDPLSRLIHVTDGNSYAENTQALEPLIDIARDSSAHIMCLTHNGKMERGDDGDALIGSTAYFGAVDTLLTLKKNAKNRVLSSTSRYGKDIEPTVVEMNDDGLVTSGGEVEIARRNEAKAEIGKLLDLEPMTEPQLRERIEMKAKVVSFALRELVADGTVRKEGKGVKGSAFVYSLNNQVVDAWPCVSTIASENETQNSSLSSPNIYVDKKNEFFDESEFSEDDNFERLEREAIQNEHLEYPLPDDTTADFDQK